MALAEVWKSLKAGRFRDAGNYLFVSQDEVDRGRMLDSRLEALTKADVERGLYTPGQAQATIARIQESAFEPGGIFNQPGTDIVGGFEEGFREGADNVQKTIRDGLAAPLNFTLGAIPWQLWLVVGLYVAWRLGLFRQIKV